jgi:deazaflavin-dependent oxidoreductase (nitroreductase family)
MLLGIFCSSLHALDWKQLNPEIIAEFRANEGRVARFGDLEVVVLHTLGARSAKILEVPLIVVPDGDDTLIFATAAGSQRQPAWVFNLRAHPRIEIELGSEKFLADVVELPEQERQRRVEANTREVPQFAAYVKAAAPREIPVFSIVRV